MNTGHSMKLDVYVNYPGHCEKAFQFYEKHLGGKIIMMNYHQQLPPNFPTEWKSPVMHARIEIGGLTVMGADIPNAEPMRSAYLAIRFDTPEQAEQIYNLLASEGQIFMKMEKTFFANRFAMLRDKFGTSWLLLNEQ
ncbi:MAG: VOC family protein [Ferruginibacter sp.]